MRSTCPPVVSDAVEEAVAVVHHGSDGADDGGVAHQAGRQHKVSAAAAADTQEVPVREKQVGGLGTNSGLLGSLTQNPGVTQWCFLRNSP